ncbi:MAG: hypothetical protein FGM37_03115 [Phycisphaerales bacterium]|nr:hypothetical protein [Phycisphaerales bacterium]
MAADERRLRDRLAARRRLIVLPIIVLATFGALSWWNSRAAERERPRVQLFMGQVVDAIALDAMVVPPALAMSEPIVANELARRVAAAVRAAGPEACAVSVVDGDVSLPGGAATHTAFVTAIGGPATRVRLVARAGDPIILVIGVEDVQAP